MENSIEKEKSFELSKWGVILSALGIIVALLTFYYQEGIIIATYTYNKASEKRLTNQLHVDKEVIDKFADLKEEKHSPKSDFIDAVRDAYGKPLDKEFRKIIVAEAKRDWDFNFNWIILPFFLTIVLLIFLKFFIPKKNSLISEIKELKEELNEKNAKVEKLTELKNNLCLCNVKQPYKTLHNTKYSIDFIKDEIKNYHRFYLFGIFADKWFGGDNAIYKFEEFIKNFMDADNRGQGKQKIKFLLTDPLHKNATDKFKGRERDLLNYYDNYKKLAKIYGNYYKDKIFACRVVTYFPIFRYRKMNNETIVSDYKFLIQDKKPGENRPHLVFEYVNKTDCGEDVSPEDDKIEPCSLAGAFDDYFNKCWDGAEKNDLLIYLNDEETKKKYEELKQGITQ